VSLVGAAPLTATYVAASGNDEWVPFAIVAGVIWFFVWLYRRSRRASTSKGSPSALAGSRGQSGRLTFKPVGAAEQVYLHGALKPFQVGAGAVSTFRVVDVTDGGEGLPVMCLTPEAFQFDTPELVRKITFDLSQESAQLKDFPVGVLPPGEARLCPKRGQRTLRLTVTVQQHGETLILAVATRQFEQTHCGWLEMDMQQHAATCRLAKLGVLIAGIDGTVDRAEAFAARDFMQNLLAVSKAPTPVKTAVNETLRSTLLTVRGGGSVRDRIWRLCGEIHAAGKVAEAEIAMELVLRVVAADGEVDLAEADMVEEIAAWLHLKQGTVAALKGRHLKLARIQVDSEEQMVGIDPEWPISRKRKYIKTEYRKWHGRVTLQDPSIREEAEQRIKILASLRAKMDADRAA